MDEPERTLRGDLEALGLQGAVKMLALGNKTGILSVTSGQERLRIALDTGHIISVEEPSTPPPDVIEIFRLHGRLPRGEAARARQMAGNNPLAVMALFVQWGIMTPERMQEHIEFGIIQALSRAVRWERGHFEFHRDIAAIAARAGAFKPLNVDHILLESLRIADERDHSGVLGFSRNTVARWMPQFTGDVKQLGLDRDEVGVLCLSNGQLPLYAISYGMLLHEPRIVAIMRKLLDLGLIELVDARLEAELERSLVNLLTQSQHQLAQPSGRATPEQRMLVLVRTMGICVNGLLAHHALFARALRGRGEVSSVEANRYIETTFRPVLKRILQEYPRMDEIVRLEGSQLNYQDVETLDRVVRGQELLDCYWDAVGLFFQLTQQVFERVLTDEAGQSRVGRQFEDLWAAFLREIDAEVKRVAPKRAPIRV